MEAAINSEQFRPAIFASLGHHDAETSASSRSFRFTELSQSHLRFCPLSSAARKGIIHEQNNVSVVDELHRPGWTFGLGRFASGSTGGPAPKARGGLDAIMSTAKQGIS